MIDNGSTRGCKGFHLEFGSALEYVEGNKTRFTGLANIYVYVDKE